MHSFLEDENEDTLTNETTDPLYTIPALDGHQEQTVSDDRKRKREVDIANGQFYKKRVSVGPARLELTFHIDWGSIRLTIYFL